jgi:hypothetical protein
MNFGPPHPAIPQKKCVLVAGRSGWPCRLLREPCGASPACWSTDVAYTRMVGALWRARWCAIRVPVGKVARGPGRRRGGGVVVARLPGAPRIVGRPHSWLGVAVDVDGGADAYQGVDERRDGDAEGDRRRGHPHGGGMSREGEGVHVA